MSKIWIIHSQKHSDWSDIIQCEPENIFLVDEKISLKTLFSLLVETHDGSEKTSIYQDS